MVVLLLAATACGKSNETPVAAGGTVAAAGMSGSAGVAGAAGSGGESGAGGAVGGGPACLQVVGVNDANLSVRRPEISARILGTLAGEQAIRIERDPSTGDVYYVSRICQFWQLDLDTGMSTTVDLGFTATDCRGMTFGSDGTLYLLSHEGEQNPQISVIISKGVSDGAGGRTWTTMATSEAYPAGGSDFDHRFAGLALSADDQHLYFGSGSRTDHGEMQGASREVPLTSAIFRIPTNSVDLLLANDATALEPYIFADGFRNPFDMAWNGDELFATENGPDLDVPEELNWIREGQSYGFPWRFGAEDNPVVDPNYDQAADTRLHAGYQAFDRGTYAHDPDFPAAPTNMVDAIINHGPDADRFRSGPTSDVLDASEMGQTIAGITAHRSPLGLAFDSNGVLCGDYQHAGLMLSFGPVLDVMGDAGADLLLVQLTKTGDVYEMRTTQLVAGFTSPVDTLLIGNKLYVIEFLTGGSIYELTFPLANP